MSVIPVVSRSGAVVSMHVGWLVRKSDLAEYNPDLIGLLTKRQAEILRLRANGLSNEEVAARLGCHPSTIKNHITRMLVRLGISEMGAPTNVACYLLGRWDERRAANADLTPYTDQSNT